MYLIKTIEQYDPNYIFLCDPIKNNIMVDGQFIRILYSTDTMVINGIYLLIQLNDVTCEKYYNKYKCNFSIVKHKELVERLRTIEEDILRKYHTSKIPSYKIYDQIKYGFIKLFDDVQNTSHPQTFILKISGIWETSLHYGLTYKFCNTSHVH
jgi:hypothetical protein